jgi:hypothetical protein
MTQDTSTVYSVADTPGVWMAKWLDYGGTIFFAFCIISDLMAAILDFIFSSNLGKNVFSQKLPMSCCFFTGYW